jgi:putative tricarboxylic transport membrane protein
MKTCVHRLFAALAIALTLPCAHAQTWKPTRNIEIIVGATAGGGADLNGRMMQKLFQGELNVGVTSSVVNRTGGGSALSYAYLNQHPGDAHYIALSFQPMITGPMLLAGQVPYTDMTPLAHLLNEYVSFAVRPDSPLKSARDLVERLRKDPASASIGVSTALAGSNHLATVLALKKAGVDVRRLRIVVLAGAGESITNVMGGHLDVVASSAAGMLSHLQSGKLRGIAVSGPQRLIGAFADVPTWKEQGVDSVYANWRGVVGPKSLTPAQIAYWDGLLAQLAHSSEWKQSLTRLMQDPIYLNSQDTRRYLDAQQQELRSVLLDVGLVK